jgi:hypothetical protein
MKEQTMRVVRLFAFVVLALSLKVGAAQAAPIVVNAGDTLTFNFDFVAAGVSPGPAYEFIVFGSGLDIASFSGDDFGSWRFFSGLDGTGALVRNGSVGLQSITFLDPFDPDLRDGVFSAVFSLTAGSVTIDPSAFGAVGAARTADLFPTQPGATPVPEPATLSLLGVGLVGAGVRRWRQRRAT